MTTDSHPPEDSDPSTAAWVVVVDYESGAEVERRGPFTDQADVEEALRSLRVERKGARYVIRVRVE